MADTSNSKMDRNLALEAVRVSEAAALSASRLMGRGDEKAADQAAVDAMRQALNSLNIAGTVVIGEGERDEHVSMESMIQRGRAPGEAVPVVLTTHDTVEAAMRRALDRIAALDTVLEPPHMIRIEDF